MKKYRNRALSIVIAVAMMMVCFAAVTAVSFAGEITVKVVNQDQTEQTVATYTDEQLAALAEPDFYPYFYTGKSGATVIAAKGVPVSKLIASDGVNMAEISGLKVCEGTFEPRSNQLPYLNAGVTYLKATLDAENNVVIEDETSVDVPFIIATEMYYNGDNKVTLGGEKDVEAVFNELKTMIDAKTATAGAVRCASGSLDTEDIAGNKFVTGPDTIKLYKGAAQEGVTAEGSKATLKAKKLKKAAQTVAAPVTVSGQMDGAAVTFAKGKVSKSAKKFTVDPATGDITVKKGVKKGKYTVTVKVAVAGDLTHFEANTTAKVVITVK